MAKKKKMKSQKNKRRLSKFFTYLYLIILSVVVVYPLLITLTTAFQSGNIMAFDLSFEGPWTLNNFRRLFTETLYGNWYMNTLLVATVTMVIQVSAITLAGYAYSRYRFAGRKQSLKFFLIVQMVPTIAALTAFYVMGLLVGGLDQHWFLTFIYIGGGIPMNTWLMKGYFDTVPIELDESARLDGAA